MQEKLEEYRERHSFWTGQVLNQFGFSINLFVTIGIGFIAFLATQRSKYPKLHISITSTVHWEVLLYLSTLTIAFVSVLLGAVCVISRLYDLRLTRHLIWARKRVLKKIDKLLPENSFDLSRLSTVNNFFRSITLPIDFINETDFEEFNFVKEKFQALRLQSKLLSELSWKAHKVQVSTILLAILLYGIILL